MRASSRLPAASKLQAAALATLLAALAAVIGFALWSLQSSRSEGLGEPVLAYLEQTGLGSPVTAVLMSFRGYDTLLELTVLLVAYAGIRVGQLPARLVRGPASPVLEMLDSLLVPFLTLFAAYLLWAGSQSSGGAFQAGAVLGAAGVLLALSGRAPRVPLWAARVSIALGPAVFVAVGLVTLIAGGRLLEYPSPYAKPLILLIEAAAMWSIGATLLALLIGGAPRAAEDGEPGLR